MADAELIVPTAPVGVSRPAGLSLCRAVTFLHAWVYVHMCMWVWGSNSTENTESILHLLFDPHLVVCVRSCACMCADLAGPLARLLVERLGSCQNGLIDRLVGWHHQQFWLIVILTISKLIFIIYLPLLYCLLILRLGQAGGGLLVVDGGLMGMGRKEGGGQRGGRRKKKEECGEGGREGESQGWQEGRKHGRRRHLV